MSFNGNEGEHITLNSAISWTSNYRNSGNFNGINAIFYGKNHIKDILAQPGCVGIRIYDAIDDAGVPVKVLIGTDANENDLLNGLIIERGTPCPPYCGGGGGVTNPLQG
jgi:hypothetical protein